MSSPPERVTFLSINFSRKAPNVAPLSQFRCGVGGRHNWENWVVFLHFSGSKSLSVPSSLPSVPGAPTQGCAPPAAFCVPPWPLGSLGESVLQIFGEMTRGFPL